MIRLLYNLLFPFALLIMLPGFLLRMIRRGNYRHKFGQRFGIYSAAVKQRIAGKQQIWVHAVSVGIFLRWASPTKFGHTSASTIINMVGRTRRIAL